MHALSLSSGSSITRHAGGRSWAWAILLTAAALTAQPRLRAEDTVYLAPKSGGQSRVKLTGKVLDYTGRELTLELPDGRQRKYPGAQVVQIDSAWGAAQTAAEALFERGQFPEALKQYQAAVRKEERRWVRQKLIARLVVCYREMNQLGAAGDLFLSLVKDDPESPYFATIPLSWLPAEPSAALAQKSHEWLGREDSPAAVLLGASHLMATRDRAHALDRLKPLAADKDPRVAALARAQFWRGSLATATPEQLAEWAAQIETFPEGVRAGPYAVLARALAQKGEPADAALAMLRAPILYPQERPLAVDGLLGAGEALEKLSQGESAARVYRELLGRYADTRGAVLAKSRLEELGQNAAGQAAPPLLAAGSLDERFLDGLRQRRLYDLAERLCRARLARPDLTEELRVKLVAALSQTLADHARQTPPAQRDPLWTQALSVLTEFRGGSAESPRQVLLDVQRGLVRLMRGELARQEAEVVAGAEERLERARQELRGALAEFDAALPTVESLLRKANQVTRPRPGEWTVAELLSLERNLRAQRARAFRNQGQSYPADSPDRTNSLRQAAEILTPLAQTDDDDEVAWQSRLDEVVCLRLLADYATARQRLDLLAERAGPPRIDLGAQAERVRLHLDQGRLEQALTALGEGRTLEGQTSAELDFAHLEVYVAAWRAANAAGKTQEAAARQNEAAEMVREIDRLYGPYWRRRAETLLAGSVSAAGGSENVTLLIRAAESFYRAGQIEQALATYDKAHDKALADSQADVAFDAAYTAAAIQQDQRQPGEAAQRFRRLALEQPRQARAGAAHLLAIYNAAQEAVKSGQADGPQYLSLLEEHLERWPKESTASQARLWLGRLHEQRRAWAEAIRAYRDVAPDQPQFAEAVQAVARCQIEELLVLQAAGKPTAEQAADAARWQESLIAGDQGKLPEKWSEVQRWAGLNAAQIWLQFTPDQFARAERILRAALQSSEEALPQWTSTAQGLLVFALAGQQRREEAGQLLDQLATSSPEQLLQLMLGLARLSDTSPPAVRRELAELELRAGRLLRHQRHLLSAERQRQFDLGFVRALSAAGRHDEALQAIADLAALSPRDGELQEEHALLLSSGPDAASWRAGLEKWRAVQKKSRPGGERWLRAAYQQALALERLGKKAQAAQLIEFTQRLYPKSKGSGPFFRAPASLGGREDAE